MINSIFLNLILIIFHISDVLFLCVAQYKNIKALNTKKEKYMSPNLWYLSGISTVLWVLFVIGLFYNDQEIIVKYPFELFFGKIILGLYTIYTTALVYFIKSKPSLNYKIPFEVVAFISISVHCISCLVYANSFLYIYLFLDLIGLCSIILCYNLRSGRKTSLLYYFLSAIGTGFLLFGISFIYFITGCENLSDLSLFLRNNTLAPGELNMLKLGYILFVCGLFIKMGTLAPFHIWISEVYNTTKTYVVVYFASIAVLGILVVLIRINMAMGSSWINSVAFFFYGLSVVTVFVGIYGAITQVNLKKILAYSSVSNIGFIMALFPTVTITSYATIIFYIFLYIFNVFCIWGLLTVFEYNMDLKIKDFKDLSTLYHSGRIGKSHCVYFLVFLFSSIGVPPLAGFFGKYLLFFQLAHHGHYVLLLYFIIMSCYAGFYFLHVVITIVLPRNTEESFIYRWSHPTIDWWLIFATVFHIFFFCVWPFLILEGLVSAAELYFFYKGI